MSIIILQSPHTVPQRHLSGINEIVAEFISNTTIDDIRNYESNRGTIWATLIPYVKLVYLPESPSRADDLNHFPPELSDMCLRVILLFLHSKLSTAMYHTLLEKEGLIDFMVCLPWYVPPSCRPTALAMVSDLRTSLPTVGPPRLLNLAKARLAKCGLGLEAVLELSVGNIASHFYHPEP